MIARVERVITQNTEVLGNTSQYLPLAGCGAVVLRNAALCSAASRPLRLPASRTATPSRTLAPHVKIGIAAMRDAFFFVMLG